MTDIKVRLHRSGEYWQAAYYSPTGKRVRKGLGHMDKVSERDAMLECARIEAEVNDRGGPLVRGKVSVEYICDDWYDDRLSEIGPPTRRRYTLTLKRIKAHFGPKARAAMISTSECVKYKNKLLEEYKENTAAKHYMVAKAVFERARKLRYISDNPFDLVTPPSPNVKVEHVYVPFDERFKDMLASHHRPQYRAYIALLRLAGLRRSEPLRLKWEHIDFDRRRIIVPGNADGRVTSKKRRREVPMVPELDTYLLELLDRAPAGSTRPFAGCNSSAVQGSIRSMIERSSYPADFSAQSLRVSCENDWMQVYPQAEVAAWLGHSTLTQMAYYHQPLSPASQRTMDAAATSAATKGNPIQEKNLKDCR